MSANPAARGGPDTPKTLYLRDFSGGLNLSSAREAIGDNQVWWLEGAIPIAPGNLTITNGPVIGDAGGWHTAVAGESGAPTFMYTFNVSGTDYIFAVWKNSGNGYVGTYAGVGVTKIFNGVLTSGKTAAAQWNNLGVLIVDPIGYWDWNISSAGALTALSNSVQSITIVDGGSGYTGSPTVGFSGGGGAGAVGAASIGLGSARPNTPGAGYKVGDIVNVPFTFANGQLGLLNVTTVNATGGITGLSINTPGKAVSMLVNTNVAVLGGSGTGATVDVTIVVTVIDVSVRGSGYTSTPSITLTGGGFTRTATANAVTSGSLGGTAIAVYAGRAWIASGRGVTFSDAGSFAGFVGSGSAFVIEDDYLRDQITALYAANNYLYIFGVDSIDVLSNVTVTAAGTANFSRVNVSASIGTGQPYSIFSYYRSVAFANSTGFYLLSGASPEKISDALDVLVPQIDYSALYLVYGGQVTVAGELCAAWYFQFNDIFIGAGAGTPIMAIYFRGRWFLARQAVSGTPVTPGPMVSIPPSAVGTQFLLFSFDSNQHYYQFFATATQTFWRIWTKLYDMEMPMWTKAAIRAAMGVQMGGTQATRAGVSFTVDTEIRGTGQVTALPAGTFTGYKSFMGGNNEAGAQFMGLGLNGSGAQADITRVQWLALQWVRGTEWAA